MKLAKTQKYLITSVLFGLVALLVFWDSYSFNHSDNGEKVNYLVPIILAIISILALIKMAIILLKKKENNHGEDI